MLKSQLTVNTDKPLKPRDSKCCIACGSYIITVDKAKGITECNTCGLVWNTASRKVSQKDLKRSGTGTTSNTETPVQQQKEVLEVQSPNNMKQCSECHSFSVTEDDRKGKITCQCCGLISKRRQIIKGAEWNNYAAQDRRTEVSMNRASIGYNFARDDGDMGCCIPTLNSHRFLKESQQRKQQRIVSEMSSSKDKKISQGQKRINEMCQKLDLAKRIRQDAQTHFETVVKKVSSFKGRNLNAICGAMIYMGGKTCGVPIDHKLICRKLGIQKKELRRCYKDYKWFIDKLQLIDLKSYVSQCLARMNPKIKNETYFNILAEEVSRFGTLDGRHPCTIAGCVIYIITQLDKEYREKYSLDDISYAAKKTKNAIRKSFYDIQSLLRELTKPLEGKWKDMLPLDELMGIK